jgi:hypothetical protein
MYYELDSFLARVENGMPVPAEILELMHEIIKQNEIPTAD